MAGSKAPLSAHHSSSPTEGDAPGAQEAHGPSRARHCLVVGVAKAGTTSLHALLARHPEVYASQPKECHYFDLVADVSLDDYRRRAFAAATTERWLLDTTPAYLRLPYVPARIAAHLPEAKLIAVLREPVARAHAQWWMAVTHGSERRAFADAVVDELGGPSYDDLANDPALCWRLWHQYFDSLGTGQTRGYVYVAAGLYAAQIEGYWRHFRRDQLLVLFYEEMIGAPNETAREIAAFLDIDPAPLLGGLPTEKRAVGARTVAARRATQRSVLRAGRRFMPASLRRTAWKAVAVGDRKPAIDDATARRLADYYRESDRRLTELLGRRLPWTLGGTSS